VAVTGDVVAVGVVAVAELVVEVEAGVWDIVRE
jgi:hypothetical protein